jgi:hypothetical protein
MIFFFEIIRKNNFFFFFVAYFCEFKEMIVQVILFWIMIATKLFKINASETFPMVWLYDKVTAIIEHRQNEKVLQEFLKNNFFFTFW